MNLIKLFKRWKWFGEARRLRSKPMVCYEKCKILSDKMKDEGVKHCIVDGMRTGIHHNWIELEGMIIDCSFPRHDFRDTYEVIERLWR